MKSALSLVTAAISIALACAPGARAEVNVASNRPIYETLQDRIVRDANGQRYYITAHDGVARPLIPLRTGSGSSVLNAGSSTPLPALNSGITILPFNPFPVQKQANGLPERVMLDELGLVTPVKDQGGRGSCTIFSAVGAIESQYLATYGVSLNLSEEYLINMMNEDRAPDWVGGMPAEKLYVASYYGLAPTADWAYVSDGNVIIDDYSTVFNVSQSDTSAWSTLSNNIWNNALDRDLANYNTVIYPPAKAHQDAIYGPTPLSVAPVSQNGTDPTPFETLLAQHHAISFATAIGAWQLNSTTGVFEWNSQGDQTTDHAIVLVGYDHNAQTFRIKNSWGSGWNGDGFADITYDLFFRTVQGPYYVTGLRDPNNRAQGGTGIWRGFWSGSAFGQAGVAVIHHTFQNQGYTTVVSNDAGYFYADNGANYPIEWLAGNSSYAAVTIGGWPYWLFMDGDTVSAQVLSLNFFFFGWNNEPWTRCVRQSSSATDDPTSYPASLADPWVFPVLKSCDR